MRRFLNRRHATRQRQRAAGFLRPMRWFLEHRHATRQRERAAGFLRPMRRFLNRRLTTRQRERAAGFLRPMRRFLGLAFRLTPRIWHTETRPPAVVSRRGACWGTGPRPRNATSHALPRARTTISEELLSWTPRSPTLSWLRSARTSRPSARVTR